MPADFALPPINERPDGFEVLAFHRGKWRHVRWCVDHGRFILGAGGAFILEANRAFAPLPQKPEGADDFYAWMD